MRNLTKQTWRQKVSERVKGFSEKANFLDTQQNQQDLNYIRQLESLISAILTRTPEQREKEIYGIIQGLKREDNFPLLQANIGAYYGYDFFKNEYDIQFKRELAHALNELLKLRSDYKYNSVFLEGIANGTTEFQDLLSFSMQDLFDTYLNENNEDENDESDE